ncbi:hypothetical protein [Fontivita pretiosa]|uniref:hypothetical protein n=1 Tax=Fontivita pretiosa TaxID=2989684 RepID=UPI003D16841D
MNQQRNSLRAGRAIWTVVVFLAGFAALISLLSRYFLIPALLAAHDATASEKRQLSAVATLLLAVVLFILGVGLMLVFRVRRFFFPRSTGSESRQQTSYVDAWTESAKRFKNQS